MSVSALTPGRTLVLVLLLAILTTVPSVQAGPVTADLVYAGDLRLEGAANWSAADGALDLWAPESIPPYGVQIAAAQATVTTERWERQDVTVPPIYRLDRTATPEVYEETVDDVRFTIEKMRPGAHLVLTLEEGTMQAAFSNGTLTNAWGTWFSPDPSDVPQSPEGSVSDHMVFKRDQILLDAADAAYILEGTVRIGLYEADVTGTTANGARDYESGDSQEDPHHIMLGETARSSARQLVDIVLRDARIAVTWGGPARLVSSAPEILIEGSAEIPFARGDLVYDRLGVFPHDQDVRADGRLILHPATDTASPVREHTFDDPVRHYERGTLEMNGRSAVVHVANARVVTPWESEASALVVVGTGATLLAVAAALWRYGPFALAALYSRLERGDLLDNALRAQVYEIVRANPGISARRIHHLSDASWGTVVHHLAKLEDAGYVVIWNQGRAKCYYENHGKWNGHREHLALLARNKTRQVAELVMRLPGIDQRDLGERSGLPQSTVSYHLLKLEKGGLVSKDRLRGGTCYFPTSALRGLSARLHESGIASVVDRRGTPAGGQA